MDEEEEKYPPRIEDQPPVERDDNYKQDLARFMFLEDDHLEPLGPEYYPPKYK